MSKKKSVQEAIDIRARVRMEAELETERAAVAARDAVIAELTAKKAPPAPAAPAPPPELAPVEIARREYEILKISDPYRAAEFLLQNSEIAYSRFGT